MNTKRYNKRIIVATSFLTAFLVFVSFGVFFLQPNYACAESSSVQNSGRMIEDRIESEETESVVSVQIQPHFLMIACLAVVGGALGMVLLNMAVDKDENCVENDCESIEKE